MVSFQTYYENSLLYHLPYFQLGSSYDVYPDAVYKGLLFHLADRTCDRGFYIVGVFSPHTSRKILGAYKLFAFMLQMQRQAVSADTYIKDKKAH